MTIETTDSRPCVRAFEVMDRVPDGCRAVLINSNCNWPHLRPGDWAVVDESDTDIQDGELYLIDMGKPIVCQVYRRDNGIWFHPYNRPRDAEECLQWMREGREIWTSDGPLNEAYLPEKMLGRVIGVYYSTFEKTTLVTGVRSAKAA